MGTEDLDEQDQQVHATHVRGQRGPPPTERAEAEVLPEAEVLLHRLLELQRQRDEGVWDEARLRAVACALARKLLPDKSARAVTRSCPLVRGGRARIGLNLPFSIFVQFFSFYWGLCTFPHLGFRCIKVGRGGWNRLLTATVCIVIYYYILYIPNMQEKKEVTTNVYVFPLSHAPIRT